MKKDKVIWVYRTCHRNHMIHIFRMPKLLKIIIFDDAHNEYNLEVIIDRPCKKDELIKYYDNLIKNIIELMICHTTNTVLPIIKKSFESIGIDPKRVEFKE